MVMIARQGRILSIFTLLLLCSTHHFAVNSVIIHEDDFSTKITHNRPYISSKITGKPVCVTPYYVPTGIKALHDAEFKGRDVKIGIIDSGIDQGIDAFNGNYNYYRDFVKSNNKSKQLPYCNNFGMHMAGIAVAKTDYFTGVAPEATLGTYRVFNCQGPTSTLLVLQALTAAINDQMKIIVLPEIAVIDENSAKLRQMIIIAGVKDVIMIAAATNNNFLSQQFFSYQGLPVLKVGGAKQKYRLSHWFEEKTTGRRIEFTSTCSNMNYGFGKEVDIFPNNPIGTSDEHFNGFHQGGIALIWYKKTEIEALLKLAKALEMTALITVNGPKTRKECDMPLFNISEKDALFIEEGYRNNRGYKYTFAKKYGYIEDGNVTTDTTGLQNEPSIPPHYPDILAPSYNVYTGTIYKQLSKPYFSNISAAVAYVAGAAALMVELNRYSSIGFKAMKTILQNNAVPVKNSNLNDYAPVEYQGAGMINLSKLMETKNIRVEPSSIDMGDTYINTVNVPIKISSQSATALSCSFSYISNARGPKSTSISNSSPKTDVLTTVSLPKPINLQPYQTAEIRIHINIKRNIPKNKIQPYSGYIVIDPSPGVNGSPSNRAVYVPYYGTVRS